MQTLKINYETKLNEKNIEIQNFKQIINQLTNKVTEQSDIIEKLKEENIALSAISKKSDENNDKALKLLSQSKVINNTTNNNNNNSIQINCVIEDVNQIKNIIEENLNANHVIEGQKGIAEFAVNYLLKDNEGNLSYVCTDPSRKTFKYKNTTGLVKDMKATKLTKNLCDANIKQKANNIAQNYWTDEDGNTITHKFKIMSKKMLEITNIDSDNSEFSSHLSNMTS